MRLLSSIAGVLVALVIVVLLAPVVPATAGVATGTLTATQVVLSSPSPSPTPIGSCTVSGSTFNFAPVALGVVDNQTASGNISFSCTGSVKPINLSLFEGGNGGTVSGTPGVFTMVNSTNTAATLPFMLCFVGSQSTCNTSLGATIYTGGFLSFGGTPTSPINLIALIGNMTSLQGGAGIAPLAPGTYSDTITIALGF
ncbi:MAG: hypothetical protein NVSMB31_18520 [Vulcanimicrobiaceae bacterium]